MEALILAIDTSCDETSAAVTCGRRVLSNVVSSQVSLHQKYGGVFPSLAKRAHQERIDFVVSEALLKAKVHEGTQRCTKVQSKEYSEPLNLCTSVPLNAVAVTYGPGLAIALEVGIKKAKEIALGAKVQRYTKVQSENSSEPLNLCTSVPLIAVNHLEGHIYSCLAQNSAGHPERQITFPALCLLVSGGHTQLVLMKNHGQYQILGQTLDDACGEALDKAAKILKLGYPGGPIIERLAESFRDAKFQRCKENFSETLKLCHSATHHFTSPLREKSNLNFSYSGLKTQFLYLVQSLSERQLGKNLANLAFCFQEACFEQLIRKTSKAIELHQPKTLLCGGGVMANKYLRKFLRQLAKKNNLLIFFPANKDLITDNAAMIGVAAWYKLLRKEFVKNPETLDRVPRLAL